MGVKHWVTNRMYSTKYHRYVHTYNNTAGQTFQSGIGLYTGEVFPDEPDSPDCTTTYGNALLSTNFTRNNCGSGFHGTVVAYVVAANTYFSTISQANANALAASDIATNGQAYANANGTCIADIVYYNVEKSGLFTKNDCAAGSSGTSVQYTVPAGTYTSLISQADADAQAVAAVAANGQAYANTNGHCVLDALISTLLIDYYDDSSADLCLYCHTTSVTETDIPVTAPENNGGAGVARYPNDGRDPATCYLLSSNRLTASGRTKMRFGVNMAYFISTYPAIDHFTFILRGRGATGIAVDGIYALRDITQGHLIMPETSLGSGKYIPSVSGATTADIRAYSTNVVSGGNGATGVAVGSPILQLDYIVSTNTLTKTTY